MQALNDANFRSKTTHGNVVVKFTAAWCQPCKVVQPLLEASEQAHKDSMTFYTCDVDTTTVASLYGVQGIPTVVLFKNGMPVARLVGVFDKRRLAQELGKTYG